MTPTLFIVLLLAAAGLVSVVLFRLLASYLQLRGTRVITCPENEEPAAVELDRSLALKAALFQKGEFRLQDCSRWPERQGCGQECLRQIEAAPGECLARTLLAKWYREQSCVLCGKPFGEINWAQHKPTLMNSERRTLEWSEVQADKIPEVLETHLPACWDCHIAETFRRKFPELVVDRPWKDNASRH